MYIELYLSQLPYAKDIAYKFYRNRKLYFFSIVLLNRIGCFQELMINICHHLNESFDDSKIVSSIFRTENMETAK